MFLKYLALALIVGFLHTHVLSPVLGATNSKEETETAKLKKKTESLGAGAKVKLKLRAKGPEVKGTITLLEENGFSIRDKVSGQELSEKYSDLKSIKKDGPAIGKWIAIGAIGTVVVIGVVYGAALCRNEGGC